MYRIPPITLSQMRVKTMVAWQVHTRITELIDTTVSVDAPGYISPEDVRDWLIDYLKSCDEDYQRFPQERKDAHWDLYMNDSEPDEAFFAAVIFHKSGLDFFCGTGDGYEIKTFCECDFRGQPNELYDEMKTRFQIKMECEHLPRAHAEVWLARTWWPKSTDQ